MASPHAARVAALIWSTTYGTSNTAVRDRCSRSAIRFLARATSGRTVGSTRRARWRVAGRRPRLPARRRSRPRSRRRRAPRRGATPVPPPLPDERAGLGHRPRRPRSTSTTWPIRTACCQRPVPDGRRQLGRDSAWYLAAPWGCSTPTASASTAPDRPALSFDFAGRGACWCSSTRRTRPLAEHGDRKLRRATDRRGAGAERGAHDRYRLDHELPERERRQQ